MNSPGYLFESAKTNPNVLHHDMFYTNQEYMIKILDKMNIKFEIIKDELENYSKWGISSYKKKENSRKMSINFEIDIFQNDKKINFSLKQPVKDS